MVFQTSNCIADQPSVFTSLSSDDGFGTIFNHSHTRHNPREVRIRKRIASRKDQIVDQIVGD